MKITAAVAGNDLGAIAKRLADLGPAVGQTVGEAVIRSSEPYVPYRTGRLASSVSLTVRDGGAEVRWDAPYAAECYAAARPFGKKFHPLATARWFEAAKAADGPQWIAVAQAAVGAELAKGAKGAKNENGGIGKDGRTLWKV